MLGGGDLGEKRTMALYSSQNIRKDTSALFLLLAARQTSSGQNSLQEKRELHQSFLLARMATDGHFSWERESSLTSLDIKGIVTFCLGAMEIR